MRNILFFMCNSYGQETRLTHLFSGFSVSFTALQFDGRKENSPCADTIFGPPTKEGLDLEIQSRSSVRPSGPA